MKKTLVLLLFTGLIIGGFYALDAYMYREREEGETKGQDNDVTLLSKYFQEKMIALGVADIGQPIEGFDANLLITAFPALISADFNGVETFEGYYEVKNGSPVFVRRDEQSITSAEGTVSEKGYATLLENLSERLLIPVFTKGDVDRIITKIDSAGRANAKIGQAVSVLGIKIVPKEVLEDSRCPQDVQCIQAGTVRIKTVLTSGYGTADQEFKLNEPITTEAEEITLIHVEPVADSQTKIGDSDYVFYFEVKKR